jgi:hypothetical protein
MSTERRSVSRGRDVLVCWFLSPHLSSYDLIGAPSQYSSGRGGVGNIRSPSRDVDRVAPGPEDISDTRGRDPLPAHHLNDEVRNLSVASLPTHLN